MAGPTSPRPHLASPGMTPLGQINSLAPAGTISHQRISRPAAMGRPPPHYLTAPPPPHGLFGRPVCWRNSGAGNDGTSSTGGPPPRTQLLDPDPGGGDNWKPDKMPYRSALRLRAGLSKARSSILTQVRTGKIGLAAFLCKPDTSLQLRGAVGDCQTCCDELPPTTAGTPQSLHRGFCY